jgi:tripartite-type tricarboxylate transporter receptor subunit TctC
VKRFAVGASVAWLVAGCCCSTWALAQAPGATAAKSQPYPTRAIRFIVPYLAGGTSDVLSRGLAERLTKVFAQPVVLDFRPGAGGNLGTDLAAKAKPDGYTWVLASVGPFATNVTLQAGKLPFDPARDFEPVSLLATSPLILITHPSIPARNVTELVRLAKSRPGQLNYATPGAGTANHLVMETFNKVTGVQIAHIPFKGTAQSLVALVGGDIELLVGQIPSTSAWIASGRVRPLAISGKKRSKVLPAVPTFAEAGVNGIELVSWFGVALPAGTPKDIVNRLAAEIAAAIASPELNALLVAAGLEPETNTPEEYAAFIRGEVARWGKAVRDAGLTSRQ